MVGNTVGIDVGKSTLHVALLAEGRFRCRTVENGEAGFRQLVSWLDSQGACDAHVCMEATGSYGWALARYLHEASIQVSVVNPLCIKAFAQSELRRTKTDRVDAKVIAEFCQARRPRAWVPVSAAMDELQGMVRRLSQLKKDRARAKTQLKMPGLYEQAAASLQQQLAFLDGQISRWEQMIAAHLDGQAELRAYRDLLLTIPGIAQTTAAMLVSRLPQIREFRSVRQLAAYAGLAVTDRQSGTSVRGKPRLSKRGDSRLRAALYFPALSAMQDNPLLAPVRARMKAQGKPPMVISGAIMRRLLGQVYGVLKSGKPFDPSYKPTLT